MEHTFNNMFFERMGCIMAEIYNRPVAEMADHLEGVVQITDHTGKTYTFRKYHWMGNVGLTDKDGQNVLLPALRLRKEIKIFHDYEAIVAGIDRSCWKIYSLDLKQQGGICNFT